VGTPRFAAVVLSGGLPPLAAILSAHGDRHSATVAWGIWVPCVAMVLINSCGFSSRYIGDGVVAREQVTDHTSAQKAELANLKNQRQAIHELRSVTELDTIVSSSQANPLYRRSQGCSKIRAPEQGEFCKVYQQGVLGRAEAISRDSLDSKITALESQIATAPAIAMADPAATVAADMLGWLSHGLVVPSVHDFATLRILILTLMPAFAGPLLWLALRLRDCRRPFVEAA
jgi:hypothetical protein